MDKTGAVGVTESCLFDGNQKRVTGSDPVVVTGPSYRTEGTGFSLDISTPGSLLLSGPVNSQVWRQP